MENKRGKIFHFQRCLLYAFKLNIKHFGFLLFHRTRGTLILQLIPGPFAITSLILSVTIQTLLHFVFTMGISIALPQQVQAKQCIF